MKPKKPREIKSAKVAHDQLSIRIIKGKPESNGTEYLEVGSWDAKVTLTKFETLKLYEWLKKASGYIKKDMV